MPRFALTDPKSRINSAENTIIPIGDVGIKGVGRLMSKPIAIAMNRRASHAEAITPTAAHSWACCAAAGMGTAWQQAAAFQFSMYQVAHQHAAASVRRARAVANAAQWN